MLNPDRREVGDGVYHNRNTQRQGREEKIYVEKNINSASRREEERPRIIVEREFVGKAKLTDVIVPYIEQRIRKDIADKIKDGIAQEQDKTA